VRMKCPERPPDVQVSESLDAIRLPCPSNRRISSFLGILLDLSR
jgi:hypothetical protein